MMKTKNQVETKETLRRKLNESLATQIHVYHFADKEIEKLSIDNLIGSGVILQLTVLGGRQGITPVLIRDGLSKETIRCIKADLVRSYNEATLFKPKGAIMATKRLWQFVGKNIKSLPVWIKIQFKR
jgi:hypothetical protein